VRRVDDGNATCREFGSGLVCRAEIATLSGLRTLSNQALDLAALAVFE
jgi:hypothetical protein